MESATMFQKKIGFQWNTTIIPKISNDDAFEQV
jgi:hypothetical protein